MPRPLGGVVYFSFFIFHVLFEIPSRFLTLKNKRRRRDFTVPTSPICFFFHTGPV